VNASNTDQLLYTMKGKVSGIRLKVDDLFNAKKITNEVINNADNTDGNTLVKE
jgi:lipoprotein-releasing system permease protein